MAKTYAELNNLAKSINDLAKEQGFVETLFVLGDPSTGHLMIISNGTSDIIAHMDAACHMIRDASGGVERLSNNPSTQN